MGVGFMDPGHGAAESMVRFTARSGLKSLLLLPQPRKSMV